MVPLPPLSTTWCLNAGDSLGISSFFFSLYIFPQCSFTHAHGLNCYTYASNFHFIFPSQRYFSKFLTQISNSNSSFCYLNLCLPSFPDSINGTIIHSSTQARIWVILQIKTSTLSTSSSEIPLQCFLFFLPLPPLQSEPLFNPTWTAWVVSTCIPFLKCARKGCAPA